MITDPKRLTDGFRGLPDGMDGSRLPPLVPPTSVWYAENVTFRDGIGAKTRPAFQEIPPSFWKPEVRGDTHASESKDSITLSYPITGISFLSGTSAILVGYLPSFSPAPSTITISSTLPSDAGNLSLGTFPIVSFGDGGSGNISIIFTVPSGVYSHTTSFLYPLPKNLLVSFNQGTYFDKDSVIIDGVITTSASRYLTYVQQGLYYQGAYLYQDSRSGNPSQLVVAIDGIIVALNFAQRTANVLNLAVSTGAGGYTINRINPSRPVYMCQAGRFLIIQDGVSTPQIYDGYSLAAATSFGDGVNVVPTGKQMAFGQGRLFVANSEGTQITAGDLIYSGSSSCSQISTIVAPNYPITCKVATSGGVATATFTGINLPVVAGTSFVITSDNISDASNPFIGNFTASSSLIANSTTLQVTAPANTLAPIGNLTLYYGVPGYLTVNTTKAHGFTANSVVTIQGTTSVAALNGTFVVQSVPSTTSFTISVDLLAFGNGVGGTVTLANAGADTDILNFTETNFLAEGGSISVPADIGKITTMQFVPLQDSATGQGDLVVLCSRGASSMAVSVERSMWSQTPGFQKVLYNSIGAVSDSTAIVNGDMFFRSLDGNGIRSYRSARAEFSGYGQVPLSAEIDPILNQDTQWLLNQTSLAYHNDRLLMTCWPTQTLGQDKIDNPVGSGSTLGYQGAWNTNPAPVFHRGLAVLDFRSVANGHLAGTAKSSYEGVWTGQNILKIVSGTDSGIKRCFLITFNNSSPLPATQGYGIWEIVENLDSDVGAQGSIPITSSVTTKAYNFSEVMALKKLLRLDLWFDSISNGTLKAYVYYRPDDWPYWVPWMPDSNGNATAIVKTFNTTSSSMPSVNLYPGYAPQLRLPAPKYPSTAVDANANTMSNKPMPLGYDFNFQLIWTGHARLGRFLVHGLEIVEPVGGASL